MSSLSIAEDLDVVNDRVDEIKTRFPAFAVEEFGLVQAIETLGQRIDVCADRHPPDADRSTQGTLASRKHGSGVRRVTPLVCSQFNASPTDPKDCMSPAARIISVRDEEVNCLISTGGSNTCLLSQ